MACGDPKAAFRVAILDPALTRVAAARADGGRGLRRDLARGRVVRDDEADARCRICSRARRGGCSSANYERVLAPAATTGGARRDAARRALRRRRDRAVDARRHARVREPADGALRHDPRRGDRRHAAARRALERRAWWATDTRSCCGIGRETRRRAGERLAARLETLARAGGLASTLRDLGVPRGDLPALPPTRRRSGPARSTRGRSTPRRAGALRARAIETSCFSASG